MSRHAMTPGEARAARRRSRTVKRLRLRPASTSRVRASLAIALAILSATVPAVAGAPTLPVVQAVQAVQAAQAETLQPGGDVSRWQGTIDWGAARTALGIPLIKATGGDGGLYVDSRYAANVAGARTAGKIGHYHFNGPQDGSTQADWMSTHLVDYHPGDAIIYDAEGVNLSVVRAYQFLVRMHQLRPDADLYVYTSASFTRTLNWAAVEQLGVKLWVAQYWLDYSANHNPTPGFWPSWAIWQYTDRGRVPGISGAVDLDLIKTSAWGSTTQIGTATTAAGGSVPYGTYLGYNVATTQRLLNARGATLAVDGYYGPATRAAVRAYQASHGLVVDGLAGPLTQASLRGTTTATAWVLSVADVQRYLDGWGYQLAVDNINGTRTQTALKTFQRSRGLVPDGIVGRLTATALVPSTRTVQLRLRAYGYGVRVDGIPGPVTRADVANFQRRHGLVADTIVGPRTWYWLGY